MESEGGESTDGAVVGDTKPALKRGEYLAVPDDHEKFLPVTFLGAPIAPNYFCRFWNRTRSKYCGSRAGARTRHRGTGRCWKHDGGSDKKITHGLKSRYAIKSEDMVKRIERHASDPGLLDMRNELAIVCALLDEALDKDEFDRAAVERLAVEANRMKDRIHASSSKNAFSVDQMKRFWFALNRTIELVLKEQPELCSKLQQQITTIPL